MSSKFSPRAGVFLLCLVAVASCGDGPADPASVVATIEIAPSTARLYTVGQEVVFETLLTTEAGTDGAGIPVAYVSRNPALVEVTGDGIATAKSKGGSTYVVTTAGGKSDSALVEVPATPCGSTAATTVVSGQVVTDIGPAGFCAAGTSEVAEYTVIVHNNSTAGSGSSAVEVTAVAVSTPPPTGAIFSKATASASVSASPRQRRRDVAAELRHRRGEIAQVAPLLDAARSWYANRSRRATLAVAAPAIGDLMRLNVSLTTSCNDSTMVDARVAAVSDFAIVLDDPRNPLGYSDDEYAGFAEMFDDVIHPLDVQNFGAPTDLDGNGRVLLVFTRSVNERTPANSDFYVGGLTHSRDLFPKTGAGGCAASNQAEMFYLLVPDPTGTINQNEFSKDFVNSVTDATIAHEYQHLINFARRKYINAATPQPFEELWLNEGLSHVAEGLLYYQRTGRTPRSNLGINETVVDNTVFVPFRDYMSGNFLNYDEYVFRTAETSPFEAGDDLATRGATWAFLRYLADHNFAADGQVWYNLVNSGETGTTNLRNRFGLTNVGLLAALRDFTVSVYTDDYVNGVPARFTQPSWNMRSIYPGLQQPFVWPLALTSLPDAEARTSSIQAGGFRVYRFRGLPGSDSYLRVMGAIGAPLPSGITITVIRTL